MPICERTNTMGYIDGCYTLNEQVGTIPLCAVETTVITLVFAYNHIFEAVWREF